MGFEYRRDDGRDGIGGIVETVHEIESQAATTRNVTTARLIWRWSILVGRIRSGILEDDAFDGVATSLAAIGDRFQEFVDGLELDDLQDVALLAEELGHGFPHDAIRIRLNLSIS